MGGVAGLGEEAGDKAAADVVRFVGFAVQTWGTPCRAQDERGNLLPRGKWNRREVLRPTRFRVA